MDTWRNQELCKVSKYTTKFVRAIYIGTIDRSTELNKMTWNFWHNNVERTYSDQLNIRRDHPAH
jgi:hypothetical protein